MASIFKIFVHFVKKYYFEKAKFLKNTGTAVHGLQAQKPQKQPFENFL